MKPFTKAAAIVLFAVAVAHVLRLLYGWQVTLVDQVIPMWVSAVAALVAGALAVLVMRESRKP